MIRIRVFALLPILLSGLVVLIHLERLQEPANALPSTELAFNGIEKPVTSAVATPMAASTRQRPKVGLAKDLKAKEERITELDEIPTSQDADPEINFMGHVVAEGDTLSQIAATYETSVAAIQELNALYDPHSLLVSDQLIVPSGYSGSGLVEKSLEQGEFVTQVIGTSAGGHPIESYQLGNGQFHVILVGAIHGGYEWNTALLAYRMLVYLSVYPEVVPSDVTLHVVPIANPDGVVAVTGYTGPFVIEDIGDDTAPGRLNGNGVDLNRNWGCDWSSVGQWRETSVSGGTRPISEPETRALRDYINDVNPSVVIWLHSAAGLLVPGNCNDIEHEPSRQAAAMYGARAGYPVGEFSAYRVTGDAADWLAQHKIASFTVELTDHQNLEFERNLAGLLALFAGIEELDEE